MRLPRRFARDQRREAYGKIRLKALGNGQQLFVTPDVGGAGGDGFAREAATDGLQIVLDLERREAVWQPDRGRLP